MISEYKKLFTDSQKRLSKVRKEKDKMIAKIKNLEAQLNNINTKVNERGAGRKAYSNKKVIEKIYNLYLSGSSLKKVANELNSSEIKTKRGGEWSKSSIRFILLNTKNVSNGFVTKEIYNRAVKLLNQNKKR